jgi:hypothetical protein
MTRTRLVNRRENETADLFFGGLRFAVTIGFFPDGRLGEVFASGAKSGCDLDYLLDDACVALSLLLQHGVEPAAFARTMGRAGDGITPASVIGALVDRLAQYPTPECPARLEKRAVDSSNAAGGTPVAQNAQRPSAESAAASAGTAEGVGQTRAVVLAAQTTHVEQEAAHASR